MYTDSPVRVQNKLFLPTKNCGNERKKCASSAVQCIEEVARERPDQRAPRILSRRERKSLRARVTAHADDFVSSTTNPKRFSHQLTRAPCSMVTWLSRSWVILDKFISMVKEFNDGVNKSVQEDREYSALSQ